MGWLNIKNLKFSFDKSKSLIGEYFLKMSSPSLLTKISNGSPSRMRMVLRISLGITTLPRVCDNWTNTGKPLDQAIFSCSQFLYDRFFLRNSRIRKVKWSKKTLKNEC